MTSVIKSKGNITPSQLCLSLVTTQSHRSASMTSEEIALTCKNFLTLSGVRMTSLMHILWGNLQTCKVILCVRMNVLLGLEKATHLSSLKKKKSSGSYTKNFWRYQNSVRKPCDVLTNEDMLQGNNGSEAYTEVYWAIGKIKYYTFGCFWSMLRYISIGRMHIGLKYESLSNETPLTQEIDWSQSTCVLCTKI